ncbi:BON domain-containing protein [Legionella sp. 16cNR16C]|uniref:BON domain-containing protein n=1 Tax=Legionella sp. 16cNR16C TaxID=2905656 RepID=UPI001E30A1A3|nr:BON domain-containing protein [Legionella sp. 16cNR16C]MCE3044510.1 BON domain-containing protein [Legionella sp. 16cNR16C]
MRIFLYFILSFCFSGSIPSAYAEPNLKEIEQAISDSVITAKIKAKYTKHTDLNPLKISVSTENGVVTLSGHVNDRQAFVDALTLAKSTKGVKSVEIENLVIKPVNMGLTDAYITAKVEAAVLKAKVFDDESIPLVGIKASTSNGTVTLSGKVKQEKSILAIVKRVNQVRGVKKIISKLQVNKDDS